MSQSIEDTPTRLHVTPSFYSVYILQSIPKPRSLYIGSTPDPQRRLRQHNGELKAGGAYRTKRSGCRPWKLVVLIYGFPSKIAALQFEHSLQHAHQTRHISQELRVSTAKGGSGGISIHHKLANVKLLINSTSFNKMGLMINIFDSKIHQVWTQDKFKINCDLCPTLMDFDQFFISGKQQDNSKVCLDLIHQQDLERAKSHILNNNPICNYCNQSIDYFLQDIPLLETKSDLSKYLASGNFPLSGYCYHNENICGVFHLTCAAAQNGPNLIPQTIQCPTCSKQLIWSRIIKTSTNLRHYTLKDTIMCIPSTQLE